MDEFTVKDIGHHSEDLDIFLPLAPEKAKEDMLTRFVATFGEEDR